jgi:hypothetical protein
MIKLAAEVDDLHDGFLWNGGGHDNLAMLAFLRRQRKRSGMFGDLVSCTVPALSRNRKMRVMVAD